MPGGGRVDSGLVPEIKAARSEGTAGTFTAENAQCSQGSCYWHGSFWSADGSLRLGSHDLPSLLILLIADLFLAVSGLLLFQLGRDSRQRPKRNRRKR
jgi:hypothetical protein